MAAHSIPQDLIDKIERRRIAAKKLAQGMRRLADFDEEIRDALTRFYAAGGTDSAQPGGRSDDTEETRDQRP